MNRLQITENIKSRLGITELNAIQHNMMDCKSSNIILISPTGSGKTIAFTAKALSRLNPPCGKTQALIIAPSRELVIQIAETVRKIASGYKTVALYGGHSMLDEKNSLTPCPDIIIATPGRLLDHLMRGNTAIHMPEVLVIDEYDKSLELGFEDEMRRIVRRIHGFGSLLLTSATGLDRLPEYLLQKGSKPATIKNTGLTAPRDRTETIEVTSFTRDKLDSLVNLIRSLPRGSRSIVFVNHRESAERVYDRLTAEGITAGLYHGALDQDRRAIAIDMLANGSISVLVATDLAARGIDIEHLDSVIHYHTPVNEQTWLHRNGRTARVDARGTVYVILSDSDTVPEYMNFDRKYIPDTSDRHAVTAPMATLYFGAGKKEKLSRGDIVGFLIAQGHLSADEIGTIALHDHYALTAIPTHKLHDTLTAVNAAKIKGKRVKISHLKP